MVLLSGKQVDKIHDLLLSQGVRLDSLRSDLLDHICCTVEAKMEDGTSFHQALQYAVHLFGEDGLSKTQEATLLLLNSKSRIMKKIASILGILGSLSACFGGIFKLMHWPGANILLMAGIAIIVALYLPLLLVVKFRETESTLLKFSYVAGLIGAMINGTGALFKLLHFPGGNVLIIVSLLIIGLIFIPIYFTHAYRLSENKLSNLAFAGVLLVALLLLFGLTNSGNTKVMSSSVYIMHQSLLEEIQRAENERSQVFTGLSSEDLPAATEELLQYLSDFRTESIIASQNVSEATAKNMNIRDMYWGTGIKGLQTLLTTHPIYNAETLRSRLLRWQELATAHTRDGLYINSSLCCEPVRSEEGLLSWQEAHFGQSTTVLSLVYFLDQLRLDINQKSIHLAWYMRHYSERTSPEASSADSEVKTS